MSPSQYYNLFDSRGNPVSLGKKVGSGGEGDVYEIAPHRRDVLAKIYHKPLTGERQEKLRLMVSGCNDELKEFAAWPLDLLHDSKNGPVCGFVMPRITDCEPIHRVYGPSHRKASFPDADWKFLVRTAKNLAAAFYIIHKYGYVVGDVNEGNILVTKKACVRLIDCDSFQVQAREKIYFCEVGVAQFTPPELQKSKDFRMPRTQNHDNFGLAILIFLLLFMGRHPFSGVYKGNDDMPIERAIAEHRFAFGRGAALKAMAPPPNSVGLSVIPREVSSLFEQAFAESGHQSWGRPSANDWWNVLDALEKWLKKCPTESMHTFYTGLAACPWCGLENSSGILLFLSSDTISRIDVASEWQKVLAIKPPGPIPGISPRKYRCLPKPLSLDIARAVRLGKVRGAAQIVLLVASSAVMLVLSAGSGFPHPIDAIGLVPAGIAGLLFVLPGRDRVEKKRRKKEFEDARYSWRLWEKKWKAEAGDAEFTTQLNALTGSKRRYEAIEQEYKNALAALQHTSRERQQKKFLETRFIDTSTSPRLSENRKAALRSFGIETAADINPHKIMSIPGFDTALTNDLVNWRKQQESRFVFDEEKRVSASDIQGLIRTFQPKIRPVEREILTGVERLYSIQQKILKNRAKFQPIVEKSAHELAQAHANLSVVTLAGYFF